VLLQYICREWSYPSRKSFQDVIIKFPTRLDEFGSESSKLDSCTGDVGTSDSSLMAYVGASDTSCRNFQQGRDPRKHTSEPPTHVRTSKMGLPIKWQSFEHFITSDTSKHPSNAPSPNPTSSDPFCWQHMPPIFKTKHMRVLKTHDHKQQCQAIGFVIRAMHVSAIFVLKAILYIGHCLDNT
jgi:hypothetical protein